MPVVIKQRVSRTPARENHLEQTNVNTAIHRNPHLLLPFVPGKLHRICVDYHNDVAAVIVRAEGRLVLPADDGCDLGCQPAYYLQQRVKRGAREIGGFIMTLRYTEVLRNTIL